MNSKLYPDNFSVIELGRRRLADSILTEYSYLPETRIGQHSHKLPYFNLILEGAYDETHGGRVRECRPAMLFFHPEGESHSDRFLGKRSRIFRLELGSRWLTRARECKVDLDRPAALRSRGGVWLASRLYRELYATDAASSLRVEGLLFEIVAEVASHNAEGQRPAAATPRWLERAKELIRASFSESISPVRVAETVGVHPIHLAREFRRHCGRSIGEYVRHLRVEFACREIRETKKTFLEIAAAAGFADQAHFARTFKRLTGLTPGQYRANFRPRR
ncbi:MAG TPA: AraC family transcriptional regulator [Pyrinomonadaceae bacterium]|nr:AraC family transcriptional regulator [Pyrinomonadaceae bacterium]